MWSSWSCSLYRPIHRRRAPGLLNTRARATSCGGTGKGPQADLQHISVTEHWRRGGSGIGEGCDVVGSQHEAVVHITGADDILVDLVGYQIPTSGSSHHPIRRDLDR